MEPKEDDADLSPLGKGSNLAEVKVKGQDNASLSQRLVKDLTVRHVLQTFVAEMLRIMTLGFEPFRHAASDTHIGEKAHQTSLRGLNLFLSEPCRIFNRLLDILTC